MWTRQRPTDHVDRTVNFETLSHEIGADYVKRALMTRQLMRPDIGAAKLSRGTRAKETRRLNMGAPLVPTTLVWRLGDTAPKDIHVLFRRPHVHPTLRRRQSTGSRHRGAASKRPATPTATTPQSQPAYVHAGEPTRKEPCQRHGRRARN